MANNSPSVYAVIAAAGMGRRFRGNAPKQLVRMGDRSMLAAVVDVLEASRVSSLVVVVNPNIVGPIRAERPETSRRVYVVNDRPEGQMIESVQMGIRKAFELHGGEWCEKGSSYQQKEGFSHQRSTASGNRPAILITPGDHPSITPEAVDACIAVFSDNLKAIVIASCSGRRGHPIILPSDIAAEVLDWPVSEPLNRVRERYAERVLMADTGEPGILVDIDTREDLDRACLREAE